MSAGERLVLVETGATRAPVELPRAGVLVVGADAAKAAYVIRGAEVDGAHCAIALAKGGGWAVRDLGSAAGTWLNGKRVETARVSAGDVLRLGACELRIVDPAAPAPARTSSPDAETRAGELDTPPRGLDAPRPVAESARPLPAVSGYRIERVLGRGGMGQVYLAVQESLARQVALKVLAPRLAADAEFVRRFQAEARAAAALNHPNVVTVYDVGEDRGTHYLSMEYMDRGNLEERIAKGGRLPLNEALDVLRDAAQGLAYAEARGIVHRDLKPANLMQNSVGQTKIADLGLATHVEAEEAQSADKKIFGTPHFMSPEQARGEKVDSRSDLYSLGATAYRLFSGHTPFEGATAKEIVRAHLREEPRPIRDFAPDVPTGVVALIARLMQKDPAARFPSASELLRELERLRSTGGAPAPTRARTKTTSGSRGLALGVLALALGGGAYWYFTQQTGGKPPADGHGSARPAPVARTGTTPTPPAPLPGTGPAAAPLANPEPESPPDAAPAKPPRADAEPGDLDQAEQLAEATARVALLELLAKEMPARSRRDELRILAEKYRGTTAATEATEQAERIASELAQGDAADAARGAAMDEMLTRLRAAAHLDDVPPQPGKALLALRAVDGQGVFAADPAFVAARKQIEQEILSNAVRHIDAVLGACDQLGAKGDFDRVFEKLTALQPVLDLPEFPMGEGPAGLSEFNVIARSARERLRTLELTRVRFTEEKKREDTQLIAVSFGGRDGLERELRALDVAAGAARLAATAERMSQPESRKYLQELSADLARAREAQEMIAREFPNWRRKSFADPRDGKGTPRNALGADASGILCEGDGGKAEHIDWSAFGANPRDIARLFHERLGREYTSAELAGIAALLRVSAVIGAIDASGKMFDPTRRSNFTETNAREILENYSHALQWAQRAGDDSAAKRERDAAALLVEALQKTSEGAYSAAVAGIERLLAGSSDTLLVRLLSDGNPGLAGTAPAASGASSAAPPAAAPGAGKPGADKAGPDKAGADKATPEKPAPDKPAPDKPAPDKPAPDKPATVPTGDPTAKPPRDGGH